MVDTTNSRAIENLIKYFHNAFRGMKSVEYTIWARTYNNHKGNLHKLKSVKEKNALCKR